MRRQIKQVWHEVQNWEEVAHNMWGESANRRADLETAIGFTADHKLYGLYMRRVCKEWPISCENALTDPHLNQRAWVGHAAAALAHGIPEDVTREAWGYLTDEQKLLANKEAERAIQTWKERYIKSKGLHGNLGGKMLL